MTDGIVHQITQFVDLAAKLLDLVLIKAQGQIRSHLSGDTADILTPLHGAIVLVSVQVTGRAARDAADIVADMGISDGALIRTVLYDTGGIAANTAGIRRRI